MGFPRGIQSISSSLHFGPSPQYDRSDRAHAERYDVNSDVITQRKHTAKAHIIMTQHNHIT